MSDPTSVQTTAVLATGYGGPENLVVTQQPIDEPGPGEARIAVRAAGVNPIDAKAYSGFMGDDPANLPLRLGGEAAGVVTAVGPGAHGGEGPVAVGDEVIAYRAQGAYAADLVVPVDALVPKPASLGWPEAGGLLLTGATAVHLLTATDVGARDVVLVHGGSGGVGLMAVQLAALRGARVVATASQPNHELLHELGATPVTYGEGLVDRVRNAAPEGITVALDTVGTDEALQSSLELVADRDRIATIANFGSAGDAGIKILGGGPGADPGDDVRSGAGPELVRLTGDGSLRVVVAATYPLGEAAAAHSQILTGHTTGKIVLLPESPPR